MVLQLRSCEPPPPPPPCLPKARLTNRCLKEANTKHAPSDNRVVPRGTAPCFFLTDAPVLHDSCGCRVEGAARFVPPGPGLKAVGPRPYLRRVGGGRSRPFCADVAGLCSMFGLTSEVIHENLNLSVEQRVEVLLNTPAFLALLKRLQSSPKGVWRASPLGARRPVPTSMPRRPRGLCPPLQPREMYQNG